MVYFPPLSKEPPKPAKCPGCGDWYVPNPRMEGQSCCVDHAPGSCCHYSETKVDEPRAHSTEEAQEPTT